MKVCNKFRLQFYWTNELVVKNDEAPLNLCLEKYKNRGNSIPHKNS